jgi:hypothetical protein
MILMQIQNLGLASENKNYFETRNIIRVYLNIVFVLVAKVFEVYDRISNLVLDKNLLEKL